MEASELVERLRAIEKESGSAQGLGLLRQLQIDLAAETPKPRTAGVEEFAKALAVTIIGIGGVPGPGMIRECVRLGRDFYDELETPTPRPPAEAEEPQPEEEY